MKKGMKILKFVFVILMLVIIGFSICNNALAWDIKTEMAGYNNASAGKAGKTVTNIMGALIKIVSIVGAGIAVIMLVVIGIQYVSKGAAGKAEAKKDLTGYIIGAVILFGVSGILTLLQMFIDGNLNNI